MMLPHPEDVHAIAAERNVPPELAEEMHRLATIRHTMRLRIADDQWTSEQRANYQALQVRETALWQLYRDQSKVTPWPWESLQSVIGPMVAGDVHIVAARTGVGKTTALLNIANALFTAGISVRILPFETPPAKMLMLLAAVRLKYDPRKILRGEWDKLPFGAHDAIIAEVEFLTGEHARHLLSWVPQGSMTTEQVVTEYECAADCGVQVVIPDHLHRVQLVERDAEHIQLRRLMTRLKNASERLEMVTLCGAQLSRGERDAFKRYLPPQDTDLRGSGALEEEADGILGLYLPLKSDVTEKEMAAVRKGLSPITPLVRANTTGIRVLKHRVDGALVGHDVFLRYDHGALTDPPLRDARGGWDV